MLHCGAGEGLARNVRPGIEKYWHTVVPHEERVLSSIRHAFVQLGRIGLDAPAQRSLVFSADSGAGESIGELKF